MTTGQHQINTFDERTNGRESSVGATRDLEVEELDTSVRARPAREEHEAIALPAGGPATDVKGSEPSDEQWRRIQSQFVDDPRKAVNDAHQLVSGMVQRIVSAFERERGELEKQWSKDDSVSTEDLRVCLQRYKTFSARLNGIDTPS
jgi:hypothetical protein